MPIITLTTDFGLKDSSVAEVKGALFSELENARIVDISHQISPFDIAEAAYIIRLAYKTFPKGSIHILGIDSELTPENKHIAVELDGHFFICANNGLMSLIAKEIVPRQIVEINIHDKVLTNFPVLDVFVQTAAHIARGGTLDVIGREIKEIKTLKVLQAGVHPDKNLIIGQVMYVDNYGNAVSNISKKDFESFGAGRKFTILARGFEFDKILNKYSDVVNFELPPEKRQDEGKKLAIFSTSGFLELAIYKSNPLTVGGASTLLGLKRGETITVKFE